MSNPIKDGTGTGNLVKVDTHNRLHTGSVNRTEVDAAIADGRLFIVSSTLITLTNDVLTPLIYIKNNDDRLLALNLFIMTTGASTGGTGNAYIKTYANLDDSSTIITNAKPALVGNANPTSTKQFNGEVYYGATGDTIVGGVQFVTFILQDTEGLTTPTYSALSKGGDASYAYQAPAGNTSTEISVIMTAYYIDEDLP